nr:hypothetical protein [Enterococcus sp. 9D6_DIV0238]OUZ34769.1 hypothetical protein A5889_000244 [Enterococcus sp. 9D6_DIV0238]
MLKNPIRERSEYQKFIIDYLVEKNNFVERKYSEATYDQHKAMDIKELLTFLKDTQPDEYDELHA